MKKKNEEESLCCYSMVFSFFTPCHAFETSSQLNMESGFSFGFSTSPLSFSLSGDLSGSGDQCAAVFIHPQCCSNSTLLTHTHTRSHTSTSFLLPPLCASTL